MALVRGLLVVLLLGAGLALVLQNSVPLSVTVAGIALPPMPLGWLVMTALLVGCATGLLLQVLLGETAGWRSPSLKTTHRSPKAKGTAKTATPRAATGYSEGYSDWHQPPASDWYGDTSPPFRNVERDDPEEGFEEERPRSRWSGLFETEDEPPYPQKNAGSDRVVDADYRVLRPPTRPLTDPEWEDDFFDEPPPR